MADAPFIDLDFQRHSEEEMRARAKAYYDVANRRRSVRVFSPEPVPLDVVETCILSLSLIHI